MAVDARGVAAAISSLARSPAERRRGGSSRFRLKAPAR